MNDSYKAKSEDLKNLLLQYRKSSQKQVKDTLNRYNQRIREYIRDETRLKLDGSQVKIQISDDFSPIFRKIIQDKERQFWEIFINLNLLKETSHGLMFLNTILYAPRTLKHFPHQNNVNLIGKHFLAESNSIPHQRRTLSLTVILMSTLNSAFVFFLLWRLFHYGLFYSPNYQKN